MKVEQRVFRNVDIQNSDAGESPKKMQHAEHGESLKSRRMHFNFMIFFYNVNRHVSASNSVIFRMMLHNYNCSKFVKIT